MSDIQFTPNNFATLIDGELPIELDTSGTGNFKHIFTRGEFTRKDQLIWQDFFDALNLDDAVINDPRFNLGLANFTDYTLKYFTFPTLSLDEETGELIYELGAENKDYSAIRFKFIVDKEAKSFYLQREGSDIKVPVGIDYSEVAIDNGNLKVKVPQLLVIGSEHSFFSRVFINLKDKESETPVYNYGKFQKAVMGFDFDAIKAYITPKFKKANLVSIAKITEPLFKSKRFPQSGFIIPIVGIRIREGEYGTEAWLQPDLTRFEDSNLNWEVIDIYKNPIMFLDIDMILFGASHTATSQAVQYIEQGWKPSVENPGYLFIKAMGQKETTVPQHTLFKKPNIITAKYMIDGGNPTSIAAIG